MKITFWPQLAIFILAVLASMGLGRGLWTVDWPYGDEIHYLIGMHSLAREGDLDLEDNYARDDGRIFGYSVSDIHARRAASSRYLPTHTPGVYLLGAGPYALAGAAGVYLLYHLLFGLLAVLLYRIALNLNLPPPRAALLTAGLAGTPVLLLTSGRIFPALPAALAFTAIAGRLISRTGQGAGSALVSGLLAGCLIWLEPRLALGGLAGLLLFAAKELHPETAAGSQAEGWRRSRFFIPDRAGARLWGYLATGFGIMVGGFAAFYWLLYGHPFGFLGNDSSFGLPGEWYASYPNQWGFLGLIFDQEFGFLFYAPALLLLPAAWLLALRERGRGRWLWLIIAAAVYLPPAFYSEWAGALGPPARYVAPVLPLALIPLVYLARRSATAIWLAAAPGWALSLCLGLWPEWGVNQLHGLARPFVVIGDGAIWEWHYILPSMTRITYWSWVATGGWLSLIGLLAVWLGKRPPLGWLSRSSLALAGVVGLALVLNWPAPSHYFEADSLKAVAPGDIQRWAETPIEPVERTHLRVEAAYGGELTPLARDGDITTRWSSLSPQNRSMWLQIRLPRASLIDHIRLLPGETYVGLPFGYRYLADQTDDLGGWPPEIPARLVYWIPRPFRFFRPVEGMRQEVHFRPPLEAKRVVFYVNHPNLGFHWEIAEAEAFLLPE